MRLPSTVAPARTTPHPSRRQRLASARAVSGVAIDERVTKSTTAAVTPDGKRGVGTRGLGDYWIADCGFRIADGRGAERRGRQELQEFLARHAPESNAP